MSRYILTGKYANGDAYGEATESLADLAYIISEINRWSDDERSDPSARIDATTLKIETEEA